jgi:phosphatidylserine/phosphatidylglycerophosphate/cardiolipin synthase-like enzyme
VAWRILISPSKTTDHKGVPTFIDPKHGIAHNKIMVIDGSTVLTGSFNFTKATELSNAENLLVIHDLELAVKYTANRPNESRVKFRMKLLL